MADGETEFILVRLDGSVEILWLVNYDVFRSEMIRELSRRECRLEIQGSAIVFIAAAHFHFKR